MALAVSSFSSVVSRLRAVFAAPATAGRTRTASASTLAMPAANGPAWRKVAPPPAPAAQRRSFSPVRVLRTVDECRPDAGRLVISGRLADVCAELDRMVAQEDRLATRQAANRPVAQRPAPAR